MRLALCIFAYVVAVALGLVVNLGVANAAEVSVCGRLQALVRPNPPQQEGGGSVTIDGKTYRLTSALPSNGTNAIAPEMAVGDRVCLTGDVVAGTTDLVNNFQLVSCKGGGAPACGASTLPSTSTNAPPASFGPIWLGVIVALISLAALRLGHQWVRRRPQGPAHG
jgi:hypothetical protein